jgi:CubicO group peptidase (beta-lactamase class C family)
MEIITAEATENPDPQPLVPWWSFSKTVLAAGVLVLVDRRKLDLDAPIAGAPYTLRHLLQHTSGLPDYGPNPRWVYHGCVVGSLSEAATWLHRLMHGGLLASATKSAMLEPCSYDADAHAAEDFGYGLGLMIEPARPGDRFAGHAGSGPGSTITAFSALKRQRTFAAAVGTDAPDTFPKLIEYLRTLA